MEIRKIGEHTQFSPEGISKKIMFNTNEVLCFILNLLPGQIIPVHRHENAVLIAVVLEGACEISVNQDKFEFVKGGALLVKGEDDFGIPNVTADLSLLVTLSPNPANPIYSKEY
jgi:quercetin dioxygenase-like cupin family protein